MEHSTIDKIRHSLSHIMAMAVLKRDPGAKLAIGPVIENGFYYDFELSEGFTLSESDLKDIKKDMKKLISGNQEFTMKEMDEKEAMEFFKDQPYKIELIEELVEKGEKITVYESGDFTDLCAGPHVENSKEIPTDAFDITRIAGAYWRGDENNTMLTRIYGVGFDNKDELAVYKTQMEEALKRDHRKLGKEMDLFVFSELVGPGLPIYTARGNTILKEIKKFSNELQSGIGYEDVHTPNMNKGDLFKVSGHYEKYKDDMFKVVSNYSDEEYFLKPMNCPQHTQIFASKIRSYRDLPIRIADFANLYRDERPGELSGLTRLRCFCQDDGHAFCREDQIQEEFLSVLQIVSKALETYKMDYEIRLSLWDPNNPDKYLGDHDVWEKSQKLLEEILVENNIDFKKEEGEAAIYGPKMDFVSKDSLGREWQISTIQLDFIMPERFKLKYTDKDGVEKMPVMIHRAIVGSPERFLAILIEHYAGAFPLWLAPEQVRIIPIADAHIDYAKEVESSLKKAGIRTTVDTDSETLGKKIRKAKTQKTPYYLILGDSEVKSKTVTVETRDDAPKEELSIEDFVTKLEKQIQERS